MAAHGFLILLGAVILGMWLWTNLFQGMLGNVLKPAQ